jgi:hypothetical protein
LWHELCHPFATAPPELAGKLTHLLIFIHARDANLTGQASQGVLR